MIGFVLFPHFPLYLITFFLQFAGKAQRVRGNDRVKQPVAHPKSMEMPMSDRPHPEEWTDEWYKTWKRPDTESDCSQSADSSYTRSETEESRPSNAHPFNAFRKAVLNEKSASHSQDNGHTGGSVFEGTGSSYTGGSSRFGSDFDTYMDDDDTPQCGELINVKPKIGERVTRIHPDYTSQLRRSRWRLKYFPRGTFPYEK